MTERPSHLTTPQLDELRREIERELARLERTMPSTRAAAKPVQLDQTAVGRLSRIDALANQQLTADLASRGEAAQAQLADALERIAEGTYGWCAVCSAAIPYGRLLVFPEARTCSACSARG